MASTSIIKNFFSRPTTTAADTVLVTGGTGFAGSHLVEALLKLGLIPHVTTATSDSSYVTQLLPPDHIHLIDLTNQEQTFKLIHRLAPQQVYHLAAFASVGSSFDQAQLVLENNLKLQLNVLEAVRQFAPQARLLVIGSAMEYDTEHLTTEKIAETTALGPVSPYAVSKVLQDLLGLSFQRSYQLNIIRVRPFNHTGERQSPEFAIPAFAKQIVAIERGQQSELMVGNLEAVRDFTDVKDVCQAYLVMMEKGVAGEVYNVGSGQGYLMQSILEQLCQLSTSSIKVTQDPSKMRPQDIPRVVADITKVSQLGWQPTIPLNQTLARVIEYWRQQT